MTHLSQPSRVINKMATVLNCSFKQLPYNLWRVIKATNWKRLMPCYILQQKLWQSSTLFVSRRSDPHMHIISPNIISCRLLLQN